MSANRSNSGPPLGPSRILRIVSYRAPELQLDQLEAAARGEVRVVLNGQELDLLLTAEAWVAYERAKIDRFVVRRPDDDALREVWLYWCKAMDEPSVDVTLGPNLATVRLDLFPTRKTLTARAEAAIAAVFLRETEHVQFLDDTYVGPEICESHWVPVDSARRVAAALYRVARACLDQQPSVAEAHEHGVV